jgi:integrase
MSALRTALKEYLALRRALGFRLRYAGTALPQFVRFAEQQGAAFITTALALQWAQQPVAAQPAHWARRLSMVRLFAQYRSASDPRTEIPPLKLLPHRYRRTQPYIYSAREIWRLIVAAKRLRSATGLRPCTYATFFALLAVTGMRISEPLALNREDVDLGQGLLTIRRTKFGKSRVVPLHPSTQRALRHYAGHRDRSYPHPQTPSFFLSERGTRLTQWSVRATFVHLSRQIGLRTPTARRGPRLHDLRHRFAVRTLVGWYRAGVDVERHLPTLATYLGHVHVTDTYWYLSATPELLHWATKRLERLPGDLP